MSERTSAVSFQTPEMAAWRAAADFHALLQALADAAVRRVQKVLWAIAKAEGQGGGYVPHPQERPADRQGWTLQVAGAVWVIGRTMTRVQSWAAPTASTMAHGRSFTPSSRPARASLVQRYEYRMTRLGRASVMSRPPVAKLLIKVRVFGWRLGLDDQRDVGFGQFLRPEGTPVAPGGLLTHSSYTTTGDAT